VQNLKTKPCPGNEPNYNTLLEFSAMLPTDELYKPVLPCEVYDYVLYGAIQPLIGTMNIDLSKIINDYQKWK
jgi:hypothetical protein